jgi:arginine decarboxylase
VLADITCDSDGKIDHFVSLRETKRSLELHDLKPDEPYYIAFFLVGAYQETLGDIHNLFGDTDTASVRISDDGGYTLHRQRRGDTIDVMLDYVGYSLGALRASYRDRVEAAKLPAAEAGPLLEALEAGLTGYTYLEETPAPRPTKA